MFEIEVLNPNFQAFYTVGAALKIPKFSLARQSKNGLVLGVSSASFLLQNAFLMHFDPLPGSECLVSQKKINIHAQPF